MTYNLADNLYIPRLLEADWEERPQLAESRFVPLDTSLTDRIMSDLMTRFAHIELTRQDSTFIKEN